MGINTTTPYLREDYKRNSNAYMSQFVTAPNTIVRVIGAAEPESADAGEKNDFAVSIGMTFVVFLAEDEQIDHATLPTKALTNASTTEYMVMLTRFEYLQESTEGIASNEVYCLTSSGSNYRYHLA